MKRALFALPFLLAFQGQRPAAPTVTPLRPSGIYAVGETVGWNVEGSAGKCRYVIKENNARILRTGEIDLSRGPAKLEVRLEKPGMVFMTLSSEGARSQDYGAAVDPLKIGPAAPKPADFDAFWKRKVAELRAIPENAILKNQESPAEGVEYATIQMDHVHGTKVHGQLAKPNRPGKFPAMLILQWASPPYPLHWSWVTERAKEGWLALNIQPHDVLPTEPPAYYEALPTELKNYAAIRQTDLERNYFVEMYLRGVRAADYLTSRSDWNGKVFLVTGTSMGGQQSFAVAGLHEKATHMIVNVPAGCDMNASLYGRQLGYPFFQDTNPQAMQVARYIDGIYFSQRIRAKSLIGNGFVDTACPPAGIFAAFNAIKGPKEMVPLVDSPHNHLATPEQQRPIVRRMAEWMAALAKGEEPEVRPMAPHLNDRKHFLMHLLP